MFIYALSNAIQSIQSKANESSHNNKEVPLRRSSRIRTSAILDNYIVYQTKFEIGFHVDLVTFSQTMSG